MADEEDELLPNIVDAKYFSFEPYPFTAGIFYSRSSLVGPAAVLIFVSVKDQKLILCHADGSQTTFYRERVPHVPGERGYFLFFTRVESSNDRPKAMVIWND